jgi:hypothetical protein
VVHHISTISIVEVKKHLRVGVRLKDVSFVFKGSSKRPIVVDLTVVHQPQGLFAVSHRLGPTMGKIDDGEAAMGKADPVLVADPQPSVIGTTARHAVTHFKQTLPVNRRP